MIPNSIHILGGGVIGLCSAWYLHREGLEVTVIDRGDLLDGTSHGNAGMIVPSHFIPMASPGVITQGLKWMFNPKSPFYIKPRLNRPLVQWLWQFYRSANHKHVKACMPVLQNFHEWSRELYRELASDTQLDFSFQQNGLLMLFRSSKQEKEELEMAEKANELGIKAEVLRGGQLSELEPEMDLDVRGGVYFPEDAHLYPNQFMGQMKQALEKQGVRFMTNTEVAKAKVCNGRVSKLILNNGEEIEVKELLVAAGAWTRTFLKSLGVRLPLQDGKGYSVTLSQPKVRPRIPTILSEAKVAITPMGADLRIGGTLELSGLSQNVNAKRLEGIKESIPKYYQNLELPAQAMKNVWQGYRPCSPDGMPYVGRVSGFLNLMVATGHGMMGMSLGPATGKVVSEIAMRRKTSLNTFLFRTDRF